VRVKVIEFMPKLTLEDKRRELLRRQLYGKEVTSPKSSKPKSHQAGTYAISNYSTSNSNSETLNTDYLTRDLTKILIFSVLAIGIQLSLYFLMQHNLVKLPF
jgi:hypothetical protein